MFGAAIPLWALTAAAPLAPPPPPPTSYANGYTYRRTMHIPSGAFSASHGSFILLFDEIDANFRTVVNGGHVEHASGFDIRFETDAGVKLVHDLERFVTTTGEVVAWVRVTASASFSLTLHVYYGKSGLVATEADPATLWSPYLAVYHLPSTAEAGGRTARNLTSVGTVASDTTAMIGEAMSLNGIGLLKLDGVAWLDNLSALTIQVRAKPT